MNVISITVDAFLSDMFCKHYGELPRSILKHIASVINYSIVPEIVMVDNEEVRDIVQWHRIEKMQLIRILIRCLDKELDMLSVLKPNINKFDYKIKNLTHLLRRRPHYIEHFPIDLNKITTS